MILSKSSVKALASSVRNISSTTTPVVCTGSEFGDSAKFSSYNGAFSVESAYDSESFE